MKNYNKPISICQYKHFDKVIGIIPLLAGAVGALAGKALSVAAISAASAAGVKAASKLMGDDICIFVPSSNMKVLKLDKGMV